VLDDRGLTGRQDEEEGCVRGWGSATDQIAGWGRAIHTDTDERARLDLDEQDDNNNDELNCESRLISRWAEGRLPDLLDLLGAVQTMWNIPAAKSIREISVLIWLTSFPFGC
jgi:hypothetical protein